MFDLNAGPVFDPKVQRYRDYARQRQMTLSDLLLENRIIFLGSSPETGGQAAITDYLANVTIQKLLYLQYENRKTDFFQVIWNCWNWKDVANRFEAVQHLDVAIVGAAH